MFQNDSLETFNSSITFRSFAYTGDAAALSILPDFQPFAPGLRFTGFQTAPGASLDTRLTFEIDAAATSATLDMQGWFGPINAQESVCVGSAFAADGSCPAGVPQTFVAGAGSTFAATSVLGVSDRFVLGGGASATYFGSNITKPDPYGFCDCGFAGGTETPEPGTVWLIGLAAIIGLCALVQSYWRHSH
jgi:hypothetical protein